MVNYSSINITTAIKKEAERIGISKLGIAKYEPLDHEGTRLQEWLDRGFHGTMGWMGANVAKRIDASKVLPNARSVIVAALNYYTSPPGSFQNKHGKISRYAWGGDYHGVLLDLLNELSAYITNFSPSGSLISYVDTGPIMEKTWASKAGIGWQGKHTNSITREYGSWVFLGVIITDLELAYDEPAIDLCGTCSACIEACPTDAIVDPYLLDSTKCISYLTIEHKGDLPLHLTNNFEGWIFGCDICQDVCPWNRFEKETHMAEFQPRAWNLNPDLGEILEMREAEFQKRYSKSPIKRTKLKGLQRNAAAILTGLGS